MAKKNENIENTDVEIIEPDKVKQSKNSEKKDFKNSKKHKNKNSDKKSFKKRCSEIVSELKKVSWPSFKTVVKSTGVVIVVVVICAALLLGIENLFSLLYGLLLS